MEINMLPAGAGDCLFIHYKYQGTGHNIWVDGGRSDTYYNIKKHFEKIVERDEYVDLLVVTHVDNDHIFGVLKFFRDGTKKAQQYCKRVKRVLFNSSDIVRKFCGSDTPVMLEPKISNESKLCAYEDGIELQSKLRSLDLLEDSAILGGTIIELPGARFTIISPDADNLRALKWEQKEKDKDVALKAISDYGKTFHELAQGKYIADTSCTNKSSIAFMLEQGDKTILMLGDASAETVVSELNKLGYSETSKLKCDCVKLSHHGGQHNTSFDLIKMLDCSRFLISSNKAGYPNKKTLARIVTNIKYPEFICNYKKQGILLPGEKELCAITTSRIVEV